MQLSNIFSFVSSAGELKGEIVIHKMLPFNHIFETVFSPKLDETVPLNHFSLPSEMPSLVQSVFVVCSLTHTHAGAPCESCEFSQREKTNQQTVTKLRLFIRAANRS